MGEEKALTPYLVMKILQFRCFSPCNLPEMSRVNMNAHATNYVKACSSNEQLAMVIELNMLEQLIILIHDV